MLPSLYAEKDVQDLWERQAFRHDHLLTEDARSVVVEFPGIRSGEGGPDFRRARILLGGERRLGDVEIHLVPSGWRAHGHEHDGAYAGVILHVVLRRDSFRDPLGDPSLPVLVLEPHLINPSAEAAPRAAPEGDLDTLGEAWFAERRARMVRALRRRPEDEVLYRDVLVALGYKRNKAAMAELARRCPLAALRGEASAGAIETRLRNEADALPAGIWRLRNVRPANHPWRRLAGMARFLAAAREEGLARGLRARGTSVGAMAAWLDPDGTGLIGPDRAREITLNVFIPFLGTDAWRAAAATPPPPIPGAARRFAGGRISTVRRYFGALRVLDEADGKPAPSGNP